MDAPVKVVEFVLKVFTVRIPCHTVDAGSRLPRQREVSRPEKVRRDVVKQRTELQFRDSFERFLVRVPTRVTRFPNSVFGAWWLAARSSWHPRLAPSPPPLFPQLCSATS